MKYKIFLTTILNPLNDKKCELFLDRALVLKKVKDTYKVDCVTDFDSVESYRNAEIFDLTNSVIMPGFYDMHFHWVQDDVRQMPKDSLLTWLEKYTFPTEQKFKSKRFSKAKSKHFFNGLLKAGTIGGACYSSIHEHALEDAFENAKGDYIIGNVLMTMNSPKALTQTPDEAQELANKLSRKYKKNYALTPRFAIATDPETMTVTAKEAKKNNSFIQTHLSETPQEIDFVTGLYKGYAKFKKIETYTDIYNKCKMLGKKTIMGHGIHLHESELDLLSKTNTAIAHCPTSNAPIKQNGLGSGLFNFKKVETKNIRWALASDIGGGPFVSMLDVMRSFVEQNKKANVKGATYVKALYRSTLAGAQILQIDKKKGNLSVGKEANFIVLDMPKFKKGEKVTAELLLEKIINKGKRDRSRYDHMVKEVYLQGSACS